MAITIQDLERALMEADKAGDTVSAQLFANEIKKIQAQRMPDEGTVLTGAKKRAAQIGEALYGTGLRVGELMGVTTPEQTQQYESRLQESRSVMSPTYRVNEPTGGREILGSTLFDIAGSLGLGIPLKGLGPLPYVGKTSEALGNVLLPTTVPQAAAGGALYSLTTPSGSGQEMLEKAGAGGLLGGATQFGLRQVGLAPQLSPNLTEQQQEVARRALSEGFQLDPTQLTGYMGGLKEGVKSRFPIAREAFTRFEEANQAKTNDIAKSLIKIPQSAPLTNENMRTAYNSALNKYKSLSSLPSVFGDKQFFAIIDAEINKIKSLKPSLLTPEDKRALKILQDFQSSNMQQGMTGDQVFRSMKSIGDNLFQAKKAGSGTAIDALEVLRTSLEDSVDRYLSSPANLMRTNGNNLLAKFRQGRQDMSNWFLINKAFDPNTGNVSAAKLSKELSRRPTYGTTKEAIETAAMLSGSFPRAFPSSGTTERASYGDPFSLLFQAPVAVPAYMATSRPVRNVLAQKYVGAAPEGLIGSLYGAAAKVGGVIPQAGRTEFGRALTAMEQQQLQQMLAPTFGQ